jgi:uncharacterized membrane protein
VSPGVPAALATRVDAARANFAPWVTSHANLGLSLHTPERTIVTDPNTPTPGYQPQPSPLDLPPVAQPQVPTGPTTYGQPTPGYTQPPAATPNPAYGQSQPAQAAGLPGYGQAYQQPPQTAYQQPAQAPYQQNPYQANPYQAQPAQYGQVVNPYAGQDPDVAANKGYSVLCYLGILLLIPLLSTRGKNSPYVRFHTNQGLILFGASIILNILNAIFSSGIITAILALASLALLVFVIMGIVNAATGKKQPLPLIGNFQILK